MLLEQTAADEECTSVDDELPNQMPEADSLPLVFSRFDDKLGCNARVLSWS